MKSLMKKLVPAAVAALAIFSGGAFAQPVAGPPEKVLVTQEFMQMLKLELYLVIFIAVLLCIIAMMLYVKNWNFLSLDGLKRIFAGKDASDPPMGHAFDGIRELDNPVPGWLQLMFYGSVIFGAFYLLHYHVLDTGMSQEEEYAMEIETAKVKYQNVALDPDNLTLVTDQSSMDNAALTFEKNCASCHGAGAIGGPIGPNLTDEYWINGGDLKHVYVTITDGVQKNGMPEWESKISPRERLELASWILSLQGTQSPDAKAPEGTKWVDGQKVEGEVAADAGKEI